MKVIQEITTGFRFEALIHFRNKERTSRWIPDSRGIPIFQHCGSSRSLVGIETRPCSDAIESKMAKLLMDQRLKLAGKIDDTSLDGQSETSARFSACSKRMLLMVQKHKSRL